MRLFITLCLLLWPAVVAAEDWTQFRGPTGQGIADAKNLPTSWSETENVTWKTPLPGKGYSSPIILGDQIWLTTAFETEDTEENKKKRLHS